MSLLIGIFLEIMVLLKDNAEGLCVAKSDRVLQIPVFVYAFEFGFIINESRPRADFRRS